MYVIFLKLNFWKMCFILSEHGLNICPDICRVCGSKKLKIKYLINSFGEGEGAQAKKRWSSHSDLLTGTRRRTSQNRVSLKIGKSLLSHQRASIIPFHGRPRNTHARKENAAEDQERVCFSPTALHLYHHGEDTLPSHLITRRENWNSADVL